MLVALTGVRALVFCHVPFSLLTSILAGLSAGMASARSHPARNVHMTDTYELHAATPFAGVARVDLSECDSLTDVSVLANAEHVILKKCHRVVDVSALGGIRVLHLEGCSEIIDVSTLGSVQVLN